MEGADLVRAGLVAGHRPQIVFVQDERAEELVAQLWAGSGGAPGDRAPAVFPIVDRVARKLTTLESPPAAIAVFPLPAYPIPTALPQPGGKSLVVYVDGVADPGNMGALVRAAVAFGATALVTSPGSTDVFGPKAVRASMGAVFGLPLVPDLRLGDLVGRSKFERVYGLAAHKGTPIGTADLCRPAVLVVGAERAGLSLATRRHVTDLVTIPLAAGAVGVVESLNAGAAGAIALYEFARRPGAAAAKPDPGGSSRSVAPPPTTDAKET